MNEVLAATLLEIRDLTAAATLVFLRVGAAMALLPAFGEQSVPGRVRLILTLAFTVIVFPAVQAGLVVQAPLSWISEIVAGLVLGMFLRFFILALQIAGTIAAQSTSLSQLMGTPGLEPVPAIGHILVVSGLALAALLGLHVRVAEYFILSYELLPAGRFPDSGTLTQIGISQIAQSFQLGFVLAAPFVVASILYNVTLGVINRAMPQLMVAFVGAPAITFGSLFLLFLSAPLLLSVWIDALNLFLAQPFRTP